MVPIHIVGHGGCGKTTLIVDLVTELTKRGIRVGTLKHSTHTHELDKPGKDSFLHRQAGAAPVTMVTENLCAVYLPRTERTGPLQLLKTYYKEADIVLIEGWISGPFQKIEFVRESMGKKPLFPTINGVKALVSDTYLGSTTLPVLPRNNVKKIVDYILTLTEPTLPA